MEKWKVGANLGGNLMQQTYEDEFAKADRLAIPDFYHVNFGEDETVFASNKSRKAVYSLFGSTNIAYRNFLYLDLTARNDWSSSPE